MTELTKNKTLCVKKWAIFSAGGTMQWAVPVVSQRGEPEGVVDNKQT